MRTSDIGGSAARGARDLMVAQGIKFAAYLAGLVILSRLLTPADFGIVAIATAIIGFGEYIRDFGLSMAAIREPELADEHRDALLWANVGLGVALAVVACSLASPLAVLFDQPALQAVLIATSATFVVNGFGAQYRASLNRESQFSRIAITDAIGPCAGLLVGVLVGWMGGGYWSLVAQFLATAVTTTILLVLLGKWIPNRPRRTKGMRRYYLFGLNYASSQMIAYLGNNADTLMLGLFGSASQVGIYSRAFQLIIGTVDQVKQPALTVAVPSLTQSRDEPERQSRYSLKGQLIVSYATIPVAAVFAATAHPLVAVLLGPQWLPAADVVTVLALAAAMQQLAVTASWLFVSSGRAAALRNYTVISTVIKVAAVVVGVQFGTAGVAAGFTIAVAVSWPLAVYWSSHAAGLTAKPFFQQSARFLMLGLFSASAGRYIVNLTSDVSDIAQILLGIVMCAAVYLAALTLPIFRSDLATLRTVVHRAFKRR